MKFKTSSHLLILPEETGFKDKLINWAPRSTSNINIDTGRPSCVLSIQAVKHDTGLYDDRNPVYIPHSLAVAFQQDLFELLSPPQTCFSEIPGGLCPLPVTWGNTSTTFIHHYFSESSQCLAARLTGCSLTLLVVMWKQRCRGQSLENRKLSLLWLCISGTLNKDRTRSDCPGNV